MSSTQDEVFAFLGDRRSYSPPPARVESHSTHGAVVFLAGGEALKVKRAVRFPYLDFSTLALRRRMCEREIEVNCRTAPDLYLAVVPITREPDGRLSINGKGVPVEWAVRMRRFDDDALLSRVAEQGKLDRKLAETVADAIAAFHAGAPRSANIAGAERLRRDLDELATAFADTPDVFPPDRVTEFAARAAKKLGDVSELLNSRAANGFVRRCHGDLHLRNLVMWQGRPVLFDAIEFSDEIASIDTLYDLAFLLMDLDHCGHRAAANAVLGRYLWRMQDPRDLQALAALPLFLALRAGIRAMVTSQRLTYGTGAAAKASRDKALGYFDSALGYLEPHEPRLIAVGGLSGSGKSTLAQHIAPLLEPAPGALHLGSDLERKALLGCEETRRLGPEGYTADVTARVYAVLCHKAQLTLRAGHSVIVDAVHARPEERSAVEEIAAKLSVRFTGLWLRAPSNELVSRVSERRNDPSDATPEIVQQQLAFDLGPITWIPIDTADTTQTAVASARGALGL
jgi:uncharacterized protein